MAGSTSQAVAVVALPGVSVARRRMSRVAGRPALMFALVVLVVAFVCAAVPWWFAPSDPLAIDAGRMFAPPGPGHWLGTDDVGRDVLSRLIHGARPSVLSSLGAVLAAAVLGSALGLAAAMGPRAVDSVVMRVADMLLAFPLFILALGIVAALGRGLGNATLAAVIVWWPQYARLIRASALSVREQAYVEGARGLGASWAAIVWRHVLPNCLSPVLTKASVDVGYMLLVLSGLSFIGLGAQAPSPEWGAMVTAGRQFLLSHWWYATFPGLAIFLVSVAWNVTGEALRDVFDPKGLVIATDEGIRH